MWCIWYERCTTVCRTETKAKPPDSEAAVRRCPTNRQGNYGKLATSAMLFFIVSKSLVGGTISKTVLSYFSKNPVA